MDPMNSEHVKQFDEVLATWTDQRFVSREQIHDLAMFALYLVNLAEAQGWHYDGHSFKENGRFCCLVVKSTIDDIPHVVFTNGQSYTGCVRTFLRKLGEGWLEWVVDRYRQ